MKCKLCNTEANLEDDICFWCREETQEGIEMVCPS